MNVKLVINGLDEVEKAAKEILEHVEAIRKIQMGGAWHGISVEANLVNEEAASGN